MTVIVHAISIRQDGKKYGEVKIRCVGNGLFKKSQHICNY